jgi:hypothetical protein
MTQYQNGIPGHWEARLTFMEQGKKMIGLLIDTRQGEDGWPQYIIQVNDKTYEKDLREILGDDIFFVPDDQEATA